MRSRVIAVLLVGVVLAGSASTVFAQSQWPDDGSVWPLPEWQARSVEAVVIRRGRARTGKVALTFDDGYNRKACARIASILRRHDAVGTFFINGRYLRAQPNKWRGILEGMEVGNHTRSHRDLTREIHPVVQKQILQNESIHEEVLGRPMLKVLRPPYGAYGERIGRIAKQLGYEQIVMWNVDTGDWRSKVKAKGIVRRAIDAPAGSIILMHCARNATAKALPRIIRHYQRRDIELTGLDQVLRGARAARKDASPERYGG